MQAGHVDSDSVVSALDLLPTVADLAGLTPLLRAMTPPGARQDGEAMSAVFTARAARDRTAERPIFWKGGYGARQRRDKNVISVRSGKWKLHVIPVVKHVGSWEHTDARVTPAHGTPEPAAESAHKLRNSARQRQQRLQMYIERHGNSSGPMLELYNLKTASSSSILPWRRVAAAAVPCSKAVAVPCGSRRLPRAPRGAIRDTPRLSPPCGPLGC